MFSVLAERQTYHLDLSGIMPENAWNIPTAELPALAQTSQCLMHTIMSSKIDVCAAKSVAASNCTRRLSQLQVISESYSIDILSMSPLCVRQIDLKCHFCLEPAWQIRIFWKLETCVKNCAQSFPYRQRDNTVVSSRNTNCQPFAQPFTMDTPAPKCMLGESTRILIWCGLFVAVSIVKTTLSC